MDTLTLNTVVDALDRGEVDYAILHDALDAGGAADSIERRIIKKAGKSIDEVPIVRNVGFHGAELGKQLF